MTVLFGTVEYFEQEIEHYLADVAEKQRIREEIYKIQSKLEDELLHDFICDEKLRKECLRNLADAFNKLKQDLAV
nr:hypothetical protein [Bacillus sp. REN3]